MLQNVFQSFLIAAEKPKLGLAATVAAGVTNMVLDALFVAGFHWGIAGAAIATGLSQCVGGLFPLIYFLRPNTSKLRLVRTQLELQPDPERLRQRLVRADEQYLRPPSSAWSITSSCSNTSARTASRPTAF